MQKIIIALMAVMLPAIAMPQVTNEAAIEQRQAAFKEIKAAVADVKDALKGKDFEAAESSAQSILSNARQVTELFPAGSFEGDTRAKEKIWDNLSDFQERQQNLVINAEQLVTASQSQDAGELKSAFKTLSKDCKGCHRKYRQVF